MCEPLEPDHQRLVDLAEGERREGYHCAGIDLDHSPPRVLVPDVIAVLNVRLTWVERAIFRRRLVRGFIGEPMLDVDDEPRRGLVDADSDEKSEVPTIGESRTHHRDKGPVPDRRPRCYR